MKKKIIILCAGLAAVMVNPITADAQDYRDLRKNTWSVYGQVGASWATGVDFKNINPSAGTSTAVGIGAGVNYNIRPWIRLGLNYEFSKFKREQRLGDLISMGPIQDMSDKYELREINGGMAYANLWTHYHNVDLTAEFNIMELWKNRKAQRFNLYAGTGIGGMIAKGNSYIIGMGYEEWVDPYNYKNGLQVGDNWTSVSWVRANNSRHSFKSLYVPFSLSAEYDVTPQLTLGVKGQYKVVFSSNDFAPKGVVAAAFVVRWNFGAAKRGIQSYRKKYESALAEYNTSNQLYKDLATKYDAERANRRAAEENYKKSLEALNNENATLKKELGDCVNSRSAEEFVIIFDQNVAEVSQYNKARLADLAGQLKSGETVTISLIGEASAEGKDMANQELSEKRLASVMSVLNEYGINSDRIKSTKAVGATNNIYDASARRVIIRVNR